MTRLVSFADGFTSASSPTVTGSEQETYVLANNTASATNITGFLLSSSECKSAFGDFEIERVDSLNEYRMAGSFIAYYDGSAWAVDFGSFSGDNLLVDSITNTSHVILTITSAGQLQFQTGNMAGTGYVGKIRVSLTKVVL
jgi:hypothetical protein